MTITYKLTREGGLKEIRLSIRDLQELHRQQAVLANKLPKNHPIRNLVFQTPLNQVALLPEEKNHRCIDDTMEIRARARISIDVF